MATRINTFVQQMQDVGNSAQTLEQLSVQSQRLEMLYTSEFSTRRVNFSLSENNVKRFSNTKRTKRQLVLTPKKSLF